MSLMQKAIRRGRRDYALGAAATLLQGSPERLWRRLCITAFEDIGVGDFEGLALLTAALKGKRWRSKIGGEWAVASYFVDRMCETSKCRAANDLCVVCEQDPAFEEERLRLGYGSQAELIEHVATEPTMAGRALALWFAIGTHRCHSDYLRERLGQVDETFDALAEIGFNIDVVEVCRAAFRKFGDIMIPLFVLVWDEAQRASHQTEPDDLPPEEMVGSVPCWAYDMHVREGNLAMARFLRSGCETARWLESHELPKAPVRFLGRLLFRVESGLVDRRLKWSMGNRLRQVADTEAHGLAFEEIAEGLRLLRKDLPLLHEERRHVAAPNS
jgi:hypothetical protein